MIVFQRLLSLCVGLRLLIPLFSAGFFFRAEAAPVVFWSADSLEPGNVVLLAGGGLTHADEVKIWRLVDETGFPQAVPAEPIVLAAAKIQPALQPTEASVKFILPKTFSSGVFAAQVGAGDNKTKVVVLNRPELWFLQPVKLEPGLMQNEAAPGALVQIVGKNFLLPGDKGSPRVVLRPAGGGDWIEAKISQPERFSLRAQLPENLVARRYELWVHNGFGGAAGWGGPLAVEVKTPEAWPDKVFDVKKDFGAKGDDVTDDTQSIRNALAAAGKNGGGVVYLPWGIYRLTNYLFLPPKTVLRGERRDASVLMWPVDEPQSLKEFSPAAIYGATQFALEDLTVIARKVDTLVTDLNFTRSLPPELRAKKVSVARDIFLRRVNLQHWLLVGHPERNTNLWNIPAKGGTKYGGDGANTIGLSWVNNFEFSECQSQGGQLHFRNVRNARETGNLFANSTGYCWVVLGGGAHFVVAEGNEIRASSSWGYGQIGMQYVYSAHNRSYNFVRGEREGMTLDISATPAMGFAGKNIAWFGKASKVDGLNLTLNSIKAGENEFAGMAVMILDGPGKGQYRVITKNTATEFVLEKPWDVLPDTTSTIGLWQLMRHMIVYKSEGVDCSAFAQLWGSYYDYIVDSCHVERNQGIWGQSGWFVQFRYNNCWFANTYHPTIGPAGGNSPEKTCPFSFIGMVSGELRVTKFGSAQYDRQMIMVDEAAGEKVPGVFGAVVRGNNLRYNQRIAFPPAVAPAAKGSAAPRMFDVVVDGNTIEHSPVGIQIGAETRGVLLNENRFTDVAEPFTVADPAQVRVMGDEK